MPDVKSLFGPMLIGTYLNAILYGVMVVQAFIYYQTYKKDPKWIRCFVLYLIICETLNTAFDIGLMYEPLVLKYGTSDAIIKAPLMLNADAIMTVLISTPVQVFICWRIKVLSGSTLIALVIIFFAFCSLVGGVATTICVSLAPEYADFHGFEGAVITWLTSSALADVTITASLVWSLHTRKTGRIETDTLMNRIIALALQTGALTTTFAILDVLMFAAVKACCPFLYAIRNYPLRLHQTSTLQFIWDFPLGKLYTNSLLSTLNARTKWSSLINPSFTTNALFATISGEKAGISGLHTVPTDPLVFREVRARHHTNPFDTVILASSTVEGDRAQDKLLAEITQVSEGAVLRSEGEKVTSRSHRESEDCAPGR